MTTTGLTGTGRATTPSAPPSQPGSPAVHARHATAAIALGLLVLVVGTFLPWLRSGSAVRTSYGADGVLRSAVTLDAVTRAVLLAWPVLPLTCAVSLGLLIARCPRSGAGLATVCSAAAAFGSVRILLLHSTALVGVADEGPVLTLAGCALALTAALTVVARGLPTVSPPRRSRRLR